MKNVMNMAPHAMLKVDLAEQLQSHQRARPARTIKPEKRSSMTDPVKDNSKVERNEPRKKDKEEDFDNVLSGHVNDQQQTQKKQEAKGETNTESQTTDKSSKEGMSPNAKKLSLFIDAKAQTKVLFNNDGTSKKLGVAEGDLLKNLPQQDQKQGLNQTQDLLPLALKNKTLKAQKNLPDLDAMSMMSDKVVKNASKKEGKFDLDPNLFEQTDGEQKVDLKMLQKQGKNAQDSGQQLQKQLEQQQQTSTQQGKSKANTDDFMEAQEQSIAKGSETSFKPTENRNDSSKTNTQHFGFKAESVQPAPTAKVVSKATQTTGTGVNKNFAQAAEMMDPKVKVQIGSHQANVRIATEKAGEIAVRLQMQQEGVTDIKLVGENAEIFNKKDELQAALQAEGLDLGQFNLSQDFDESDKDAENEESFEQEENGTVVASQKVATPARVKNGATLHVQA
jgi:hypothetical protein